MESVESERLLSEFKASSPEEWKAAAEALLKGAPFDKKMLTKTVEGIVLQPIYWREALDRLPNSDGFPGQEDFARGRTPEGFTQAGWEIAQETGYGEPEAFNEALLDDLNRGQTALNALLDAATQLGVDPAEAKAGQVGVCGLSLACKADLATALNGVYANAIGLHIQSGLSGLATQAFLAAWLKEQGVELAEVRGSLNMDPLGVLASTGRIGVSLTKLLDELALLVRSNSEAWPQMLAVGVSGLPYHGGGATAVEELGAALATGVYYLRELGQRGCPIDQAAKQMRFTFSVGGDFFMEVSKFRAARQLWSRIVRELGGSEEARAMRFHARTGLYNKTKRDPYVNMLRVTTEALAAVVGGADSLSVGAFDEALRAPTDFSRRIARNTQIILQEECELSAVMDPAGGSWFIESLTDELAREAWGFFRSIEKEGGMLAALGSGMAQKAIAAKRAEREKLLGQRRISLVGTNQYANSEEKPLPADRADAAALLAKRKRQLKAGEAAALAGLGDMSGDGSEIMEKLVKAADEGATLGQICRALRGDDPGEESCEALPYTRLSIKYEELRDASDAYREKHGRGPQIFLLNIGPLRRHKIRADFTRSFFQAGGFEIVDTPGFDEAEAAGEALEKSGARLAVICGTDDDYAAKLVAFLKAARSRNPEAKLILAGFPGEQEAAYREAGLDDYIFIKSDNFEVNRKYLEELGAL